MTDNVFQGYSYAGKGAIYCGTGDGTLVILGRRNVFYDCTSNSNIVRRMTDARVVNPLFKDTAGGDFTPKRTSSLNGTNQAFPGQLTLEPPRQTGALGSLPRRRRLVIED